MELSVLNGYKKQKILVLGAAGWVAPRLIRASLLRNIRVDIKFRQLPQVQGLTEWTDSHRRPREFLIQLERKLPDDILLEILFHEFVHVKQYAYNELRDVQTYGYRQMWKNQDCSNIEDYYQQPWEIEAFTMSEALLKEYLDETKT